MIEKTFSTLPAGDQIRLPSGEGRLLEAGETPAELEFVVERQGEAVLQVSIRWAVFGRSDVCGKGVAPTLIALLGACICQCLRPGVVCIERQTPGEATLEGHLQAVVVRDTPCSEITDATQIGKRSVKRASLSGARS